MVNVSRYVAMTFMLLAASPAYSQGVSREYERHIEQARAGQTAPALAYLEQLLKKDPHNRQALNDYVVILGWAERPRNAFTLHDRIDTAHAPLYVVTSLAGSARKIGELTEAKKLYRIALERDSSDLEATIGLALALSDSGYPEPALISLQRHLADAPPRQDRIALLRAQADIYAAHNDFPKAADALQRLLTLDTKDSQARRDLAVATDRIGAAPLAMEQLEGSAATAHAPERAAIALDRGATRIRWSGIGNATADQKMRFAAADRALAENSRLIEELSKANSPDADALRRARFDRVSALRNRVRMRDAVALFETLRTEYGDDIPPYVRTAAADAYLYQEQPQRARDLYLQAQRGGEDDAEAKLGLFYAYIECEQFDQAYRLIDDLVKHTPKLDGTYRPPPPNPAYLRVRIAQAMARSYGDQQIDAGHMLDELNRSAPFDSELRANRARWMSARGWHNQAQQEFAMLGKEDPTYPAAAIGLADTQLELKQYRVAESSIAALALEYPEDKGVQDLQRRWDIHNMRELTVDTSYGRGSGGVLGNRDFALEALLYSAPFAYNYRAFARLYDAEADFDGVTGFRRRAGAGLEYRNQYFTLSGMVNQSTEGDANAGIGAALEWRPDDFWSASVKADSSVDDIPLRARPSGVTAHGIDSEVFYRWNESAKARAGFGFQDFSDGNQRGTWNIGYQQRLVATPRYKLDADVSVSGSQNSDIPAAPYFNPRHDQSLDLTLTNEWLVWRRYRDVFVNRLMLSAGDYAQRGFGSGAAWDVRYEQERDWEQRLTLRYGLGRSSHPYDGVNDQRNYLYLSLDWMF